MTAAPASTTTTMLLCCVEAAPMNSDETVLALGAAAMALVLGLASVLLLVGTAVVEERTMVEVAVAWTTVLVIVVVEASDTVVSCAKTEEARMTESVAKAAVKCMLRWVARYMEIGSRIVGFRSC